MDNSKSLPGPKDWWRQAIVYQIYPRSFADGNADGIGDLQGMLDRVDYLVSLGIDAIWLSPFYPSELADGGYDVADYRDVDPRIGNLEQFDQLIEVLHSHNIRIFVDIVPNHTSDQHVWFQEALAAKPGSAARARYIFRDGRGEHGELPPSDLASHFGPEGWTRVADGQWYMHLFAKEQPDLNWENPEVRTDFLKTLEFWSDRGVDGFRIDVAHALTKQLDPLPSRSSFALEVMRADGTDPLFDRDEVHEVYREWRRLFDQYNPPRVAVAEAWVHSNRRFAYAAPDELGQVFNFDLLTAPFERDAYQRVIRENLQFSTESGSSNTWVLSNHDVIRHATRLVLPTGIDESEWYLSRRMHPDLDLEVGAERAKAATMLILALPGSTYLYQGEELGLHEVLDIPSAQMQDPQWWRGEGKIKSRDGCRVPLPWQSRAQYFGFGGPAHLPQPGWFFEYAVDSQHRQPQSSLELYRAAIRRRRKLVTTESLEWLEGLPAQLLGFRRPNGWISITNFGPDEVRLNGFANSEMLLSSNLGSTSGRLAGNSTIWLRERS